MRAPSAVRRILGVATVALVVVGLAGCDPAPKLTITPRIGPPGTVVSLTLEGCTRQPHVDYWEGAGGGSYFLQEAGPGRWEADHAIGEVDLSFYVRCGGRQVGTGWVDAENPQLTFWDTGEHAVHDMAPGWDPYEVLYGTDCPSGATPTVTVPRGTPRVLTTSEVGPAGNWKVTMPRIAPPAPGRSPKITIRATCGSVTYRTLTFTPIAD